MYSKNWTFRGNVREKYFKRNFSKSRGASFWIQKHPEICVNSYVVNNDVGGVSISPWTNVKISLVICCYLGWLQPADKKILTYCIRMVKYFWVKDPGLRHWHLAQIFVQWPPLPQPSFHVVFVFFLATTRCTSCACHVIVGK